MREFTKKEKAIILLFVLFATIVVAYIGSLTVSDETAGFMFLGAFLYLMLIGGPAFILAMFGTFLYYKKNKRGMFIRILQAMIIVPFAILLYLLFTIILSTFIGIAST